jgi:hypothetical protein
MKMKSLILTTAVGLYFRPSITGLLVRALVAGGFAGLPAYRVAAQTGSSAAAFGSPTIARAVCVKVSNSSLFGGAMVAKNGIDLNGNNILTDSFDSSDPAKSTNGQYDPAKAGDCGDVATDSGVINSLNLGNANIYGHARTGPGGSIALGPSGAIGAHSWQAANSSGIESGWVSTDANFTFPNMILPYTSGLTPLSGAIVTSQTSVATNSVSSSTYPSPAPAGGVTTNVTSYTTVSSYPTPVPGGLTTNFTSTTSSTLPVPIPSGIVTNLTVAKNGKTTITYTYSVATYTYPNCTYTYSLCSTNTTYVTNAYDNILYTGDYSATSLSGKTIVLGNARLVLPNGLNMASKDSFTVGPTGTVAIYSDGTSCTIGGLGVNNQNGLATSFAVYCTANVTSFTLNANAAFTGVLVASKADLVMNGGGSTPLDFQGTLMVNSVKMNGHFRFHFDQALSRIRNGRYLVSSWDEVAPPPAQTL